MSVLTAEQEAIAEAARARADRECIQAAATATPPVGRSQAASGGGEPETKPAPPAAATSAPARTAASATTTVAANALPLAQGEPGPVQPDLFTPTPGARLTDPLTSHLAAQAHTRPATRDIHDKVLAILLDGPATDFDLARRTGLKQTSVGCRRHELCKQDPPLVEELDRNGRSDTGSPCNRYQLTDHGRARALHITGRAA